MMCVMRLIAFAAQNHKGLRDRVELDLSRPSLSRLQPDPGEGWNAHLQPVICILGANASGKSTVLDAVHYAKSAVASSATGWQQEPRMPRAPFALEKESREAPSTYEFSFVHEDDVRGAKRFDYGFVVSDRGIEKEWLYALYGIRRERLIDRDAAREGSAEFSFARSLPRRAELTSITRRELILSRALLLGHPVLAPLGRSLTQGVEMVPLGDVHRERRLHAISEALAAGEIELDELVTLLQIADIGIESVEPREENLPPEFVSALEQFTKAMAGGGQARQPGDGSESPQFSVEMADAVIRSLAFFHRSIGGESVPLGVNEESSGTIAWLTLAVPAVEALRHGGVLLVDEIDASLHSHLLQTFVQLFLDPEINLVGAQLVFTTHDTFILSPASDVSLEPGQVWFTEKQNDGCVELYSLADFAVRDRDNVAKRYLEGRYGAVPRLASSLVHRLIRPAADVKAVG